MHIAFYLTCFSFAFCVITCAGGGPIKTEIPLPLQDMESQNDHPGKRRVIFYNMSHCPWGTTNIGCTDDSTDGIQVSVNEKRVAYVDPAAYLVTDLEPGAYKIGLAHWTVFKFTTTHDLFVSNSDVYVEIRVTPFSHLMEVSTYKPIHLDKFKPAIPLPPGATTAVNNMY